MLHSFVGGCSTVFRIMTIKSGIAVEDGFNHCLWVIPFPDKFGQVRLELKPKVVVHGFNLSFQEAEPGR